MQRSWKQFPSATNDPVANTPPVYARPIQMISTCTSLSTVKIISLVRTASAASDHHKPRVVTSYSLGARMRWLNDEKAAWLDSGICCSLSPVAAAGGVELRNKGGIH